MHIAIDDAKLHVRTAGDGDAVVLLHGFPLSSEVWETQIAALSKTHFVVAPDLRGLGKSSVGAGPYLMETLAGDLAGILETLGVGRASIVGHSVGGYVALAFFRMFSERVERLALICSRIDADTPDGAKTRLNLADMAESANSMQPIIDFYNGRLIAKNASAEVRNRVRAMMEATSPVGAASILRGIAARVSSEDLLPELHVPVLIVTGGQDAISPAAIWDGILPGSKLEVFERSAHVPMLEEPGALTEGLENFLRCSGAKS